MLRQIDVNLWVADQSLRYLALDVGTRMSVIRLADRQLAVISPIDADPELEHQLNELGTVRYIIAPNLYHHLFVAKFKALYPFAQLWAAPGLGFKQPDLPIDRILQRHEQSVVQGLEYLLFDGFKTLGLNGAAVLNECVFFHHFSRTLILTDTAFHFDQSYPWVTQIAARVLGSYQRLSPSVLERIATRDKQAVRQSVENVLAWDFDRVIMAHGTIIETGGKRQFRRGYEQFLGQPLRAAV
jgi:hypothetical protein